MSVDVIAEYLRLSSEDVDLKEARKTESNSISNQRDLLNAHIAKIPEFSGSEVVEFCDDGWSGKNFERPALQEMLAQVRQRKIQRIVLYLPYVQNDKYVSMCRDEDIGKRSLCPGLGWASHSGGACSETLHCLGRTPSAGQERYSFYDRTGGSSQGCARSNKAAICCFI